MNDPEIAFYDDLLRTKENFDIKSFSEFKLKSLKKTKSNHTSTVYK